MDFKDFIIHVREICKAGLPAGGIYLAALLIKKTYAYILRRTPMERTKKSTDSRGNPIEITEKYRP
jgi:hypothetical protein